MQLHMRTWAEVEAYLQTSTLAIVPIGSTEQHGPNGLIGTDALNAERVAIAVGERTGTLVAPTISVGMAQHHMAFKGSMTLRPSTLIQVIHDYIDSLAHHGFERFFFINGHGGNSATVTAAFQEIYAGRSLHDQGGNQASVRCKLRNWWEGPKIKALIKELFGDKDGMHATISEVSVTQYLFPEHIKQDPDMGPPPPFRGRWSDAADYRAKFPDGRIGSHPGLATPEAGEQIFTAAIADIAEEVVAFSKE
ncbi:MAG: creatininase family protein [Alphaproteobacteria bacterium]|mgnify:CR=1 FL=1|jgi:creatinine amidohydrolase|nr:creatininase family protein [Alphaproteobacteria bacterium]MDP6687865.1 creatininase family protein [Alphaproteobacteria bacterium]